MELLYIVPFHHTRFISQLNIFSDDDQDNAVVTNLSDTYIVVKFFAFKNIWFIFSTLLVSKLPKSKVSIDSQYENAFLIRSTLLVLKFSKFSVSSDSHQLNI